MKKTILITILVLVILGLLILVPVGFVALMWVSFEKQTTDITDIEKYPSILSHWKKSIPESVAHFPDEIPSEASNIQFYYRPSFLQGDAYLSLKFQAPPEMILQYHQEFKALATKFIHNGYYPSQENVDVMYFQNDPDNTPEHEPEYGVVISKKDNIIIFWADAVVY